MANRKSATLEVVELATGKVVHTVKVTNPDGSMRGMTKLDTVEMGLLRNMNTDKFRVREKDGV